MQDLPWDPEAWNYYEASFAVTDELAACESVEVWIHQINRSWNIEVDDVQIYAIQSGQPRKLGLLGA